MFSIFSPIEREERQEKEKSQQGGWGLCRGKILGEITHSGAEGGQKHLKDAEGLRCHCKVYSAWCTLTDTEEVACFYVSTSVQDSADGKRQQSEGRVSVGICPTPPPELG